MFVDFFIRRPVFATVCALLIILAGSAVIPTLPIAQFPTLAPPQVSVTSVYVGASAQTVESAVTVPLEQQINGAEGMKYITSTSSSNGVSTITATFDLNRDPDLAAVDIQNRVNTAQGRLPNAVKATGITIVKASSNFVLGAAVFSPEGRYYSALHEQLPRRLRKGLAEARARAWRTSSSSANANIPCGSGWTRCAWPAAGLTASDAVSALQEQNVDVAAGQVGQPPIKAGQEFQISVRAIGRLTEASQFENIILKTNSDGTLVRLKDVGRAELGAEDYSSDLMFNGYNAVGLGVTQLSSANALEVDRLVLAELDRLSKHFPPGMKYQNAFDTTEAVGESIRDVLTTLIEAIVLVILVIFIFLQDWRSTVIPAVTIPVSLIGTFAFVKLLGFSVNTLTLFGITLATGLVVDDAIVVIENIERHIQEGESDTHKAASVAMSEVAGAVIATSLVLVAVFVPVAFFPGTTGILFRQFALTIAFSISISAFNALTLTPALSAILLGREHREKNWFFRAVDKVINGVTEGYRRILRVLLRFKLIAALLFLGALGLDLPGFPACAQRLRAQRRPGLLHHRGAGAVRGIARIHEAHQPADPGHSSGHSGSRRNFRHRRFQLQRQRLQPGPGLRPAEAVLPAQGRRARRRCHREPDSRPPVRYFRRAGSSVSAARRAGTGPVRRLCLRTAGPGQPYSARNWRT